MAFDLEAARKAGYTDAEIAGHLAQRWNFDLSKAKSSGYSDGEVIAHLMAKTAPLSSAPIPGQEGEAARVAAARAQPAPTVPQRIAGAAEAGLTAVTGATGGTLGGLAGMLQGLAGEILAGRFGTQQAAQAVDEAAAKGSQALTYQPRTEQGQDQAAALGQVLQQLVPVAGLTPQMTALGQAAAARPAAPAAVTARTAVEGTARDIAGQPGAAAAAGTLDAAARVADLAKTQATTLPRRALDALRRKPEDSPAPTPGTMGSFGAAGTDVAGQRQALANSLPVPIRLTKGQASRDPAQLKFEVESAKLPGEGAPLRERMVEQNFAVLRNFDTWVDQTGAQAPNIRAVGQVVDQALVQAASRDKAKVRAAYKAAEKAGELEAPVTLASAVQHLNDAAPEATTAPLLTTTRAVALKLGVAREEGGALVPQPVTLNIAEQFRKAINRNQDLEPTNIRQGTILRGLIDESTEGLGGDLYRQARALRRRFAQNYEDRATIAKLLATRRGTSDRAVAFEDVFKHSILSGSLDDVGNVRRVLLQRGGPEGILAWRELQGATVQHIKDRAFKSTTLDSAGRPVMSNDALVKAIRELDVDGRLELILGRKGAQQMRDLSELSQVIRSIPPEAAVNTANTASTLLAALADAGVMGMSGVPAPVVSIWRAYRQYVKDKTRRQRIDDALRAPGQQRPEQQAPQGPRGAPPGVTLQ